MNVISHFQTRPLLDKPKSQEVDVDISLDLGLSLSKARLNEEGVAFENGPMMDWDTVENISEAKNNCFLIEGDKARKVILFSEHTNRAYSLMPKRLAPTMLLSGTPMHRIKDTEPYWDTLEKTRAIEPISGDVLDTTTGLGYTAIQAAKTASRVVTIELDPAVLEIAALNPWSRELFGRDNIEQLIGDSFDLVKEFENSTFNRIIHDPPELSLAGNLYSLDFYCELYRILKADGRLFHYIGNPTSPSGARTTKGVIQRLKQAGFSRIKPVKRAFGVVASK